MSHAHITARRERGNIMALMALSMTSLIGAAALGVDYAALGNWKSELQSAADSAALAGAAVLPGGDHQAAAMRYAAKNSVAGLGLRLSAGDIVSGIYDFDTATFTPAIGVGVNAVEVTARRDGNAPDGPFQMFFGGLLGQGQVPLSAASRAVLDQRLGGIRNGRESPLVPFLVDAETFGGIHDGVINPPIGETVEFFPTDTESGESCGPKGKKKDNTSPSVVPGNFGLADLDGGSNGVPELRDWIENGYDGDFQIPDDPGHLVVSGSPGVDNGIRASVESRLGDTVAVMVYDQVEGNGANAAFRVRSFVAIEITKVRLTGKLEDRHIRGIVREMPTSWAITSSSGMTNGSVNRLRLVP